MVGCNYWECWFFGIDVGFCWCWDFWFCLRWFVLRDLCDGKRIGWLEKGCLLLLLDVYGILW